MSETTITFGADSTVTTSPIFLISEALASPTVETIDSGCIETECLPIGLEGGVCVVVGQQGPPGPPGEDGGGASGQTYTFSAATSWTVNHNLGYQPIVSLHSAGGVQLVAQVVHTSLNQAVVTFNTAQAGSARII